MVSKLFDSFGPIYAKPVKDMPHVNMVRSVVALLMIILFHNLTMTSIAKNKEEEKIYYKFN